jgi:hypothetical protein
VQRGLPYKGTVKPQPKAWNRYNTTATKSVKSPTVFKRNVGESGYI